MGEGGRWRTCSAASGELPGEGTPCNGARPPAGLSGASPPELALLQVGVQLSIFHLNAPQIC